jgi:hypothetical protein
MSLRIWLRRSFKSWKRCNLCKMRSVTKLLCTVRASTATQRQTVDEQHRHAAMEGARNRPAFYVLLYYIEAENYSGLQCRTQCDGCGVARQDALQTDLEKRGPNGKLFQQSHFTTSLPWPYTISFLLLGAREWLLFTFQPCPPFCQNLMIGNDLLKLDLWPPCLQMSGMNPSKDTACAGPLAAASSLNSRKLSQKAYHAFNWDNFN